MPSYPAGTHCWVDVLAPDARALLDFYGGLFGWEFAGPGPMPDGGEYYVARLGGLDVCGLGTAPARAWTTYVRVDSVADTAARAGDALMMGPLDALPPGRFAILCDPTRAVIGVWEPGEREGAQVTGEPGTWQMSSLHTPDAASAAAFYGELFGWETAPLGPLTAFRLHGEVVAVIAQPDPSVPPHWNVNFRVAGADASAARVTELGGTVMLAPFDTPGFRNAVFADPQGAVFSVSQIT